MSTGPRGAHAASKTTPRADRSNVLDTRPHVDPPPAADLNPTEIMPRIDPDNLAAPGPVVGGRADLAELLPPRTHTENGSGSRSIPVGAVPESAFLNPSAADFAKWAEGWLSDTAPAVQAKAAEYGSNSLAAAGHKLARLQGRIVPQVEALELGCFDYAHGKMERVFDAVLRGQLPGRDSWHDLAVYSLMVLYMREFGRWP